MKKLAKVRPRQIFSERERGREREREREREGETRATRDAEEKRR